MRQAIPKGTLIVSRDGEHGRTTGGVRECRCGGAGAIRVGVRWLDGKITYPCTKGMTPISHNPENGFAAHYRID